MWEMTNTRVGRMLNCRRTSLTFFNYTCKRLIGMTDGLMVFLYIPLLQVAINTLHLLASWCGATTTGNHFISNPFNPVSNWICHPTRFCHTSYASARI